MHDTFSQSQIQHHGWLKILRSFTNLDVPDNLTVALSDELNLHLGTLTLGASPAQNLDDPREGDAGLVHADALLCNTDNPSDPP